ncbi:MAG: hypothetical protein KatS3mg080_0146 [Anoxybacillus sp.]|nr:MAG: hypothetical protein KatS3mg080_0146 [Anoxybacillus sp.]
MIDRIQRALPAAVQPHAIEPAEAQRAFSQFLKEAINEVNRQQLESDQLTTKLAKGENVDLHNGDDRLAKSERVASISA